MPAEEGSEPTSPVTMTAGLGETVLADEPARVTSRLASAAALPGGERRAAVADVVADHPRSLAAWAELAALGRDPVERYAYFRVGYHRGLDALRAAGWRGSGAVRWVHTANRPFLTCLDGLRQAAGAIGERDEEERCATFLRQLDPAWRPDGFGAGAAGGR